MHNDILDVARGVPVWQGEQLLAVREIRGGWTNKNYRVDTTGRAYMMRIGQEHTRLLGIDRQQEYAMALAAAQLGIAPKALYFSAEDDLMVFEFVDAPPLNQEEMGNPDTLGQIAELLRKVHSLPKSPKHFCPFRKAVAWLRRAEEHGVLIPGEFQWTVKEMEKIRDSVPDLAHSCLCQATARRRSTRRCRAGT